MYDCIVIGGGASGLMAAGRAAEVGQRVLLLEKNRSLGEKLKITGNGRCNITNAEFDVRTFAKAYGASEQFLYSLFAQFGVAETFEFFESRGLPLVVEERKRAFPHTFNALDVLRVLEEYVRSSGVELRLGTAVTRIEMSDGSIKAVHCGKERHEARSFIFSTGSVSHPETGSTGDGFTWLRELGHTIVTPTPTVVPLAVKEEWVTQLAGVTLPNMQITFQVGGKKVFSKRGSLLFTHFGLSGPLILNSASAVADLLRSDTVTAAIDLFPTLDLGALEREIIRIFDANKNKILRNVCGEFVTGGVAKGVLMLLETRLDTEIKVHSVTKEDRKVIARMLKALPLTVTGLMGFDRAVVADGGVPLTELDMRTMRSRIVPNLYLTGDLLHINRPSGGYSLQLCWSTGYVAGSSCVRDERRRR